VNHDDDDDAEILFSWTSHSSYVVTEGVYIAYYCGKSFSSVFFCKYAVLNIYFLFCSVTRM
jgi:hypothetical protein